MLAPPRLLALDWCCMQRLGLTLPTLPTADATPSATALGESASMRTLRAAAAVPGTSSWVGRGGDSGFTGRRPSLTSPSPLLPLVIGALLTAALMGLSFGMLEACPLADLSVLTVTALAAVAVEGARPCWRCFASAAKSAGLRPSEVRAERHAC